MMGIWTYAVIRRQELRAPGECIGGTKRSEFNLFRKRFIFLHWDV